MYDCMVMPQKDIVLQELNVISSTFQWFLQTMAKLCSVVSLLQLLLKQGYASTDSFNIIPYYTFHSKYSGVEVSVFLTQGAFVLDVQTLTHSMPLVHHEVASISGSQVYQRFCLCLTLLEMQV